MKLVQLNVEHHKHAREVRAFLEAEQPDVVCLQEIDFPDLIDLQHSLALHAAFAPMVTGTAETDDVHGYEGVAILTRVPYHTTNLTYYARSGSTPPPHSDDDRESPWQPLLAITLPIDQRPLTILTTHFMKSFDGLPDNFQRNRMQRLLPALGQHTSFVLCGDMNIPRGTELYNVLNERYCDNVPPQYTNSLDPNLHRVAGLHLMVDYLWSTPEWYVDQVYMVDGISDHQALVGNIVSTHD